jgi:hypothetical protein
MPHDLTAALSAVASAKAEWMLLISLGAFHGINPGMGWLFAVALGLQERRRGAVLRALIPLGAGHALAVAGSVGVAMAMGAAVPIRTLRWSIAIVLVSLGVLRFFRHLHPRWVSMRVGMSGLTVWSFLMATAHGAGLMATNAGAALFATGVHAASYLAVTAIVALLVFDKLGVGILRRAWFNVDAVWAGALVATGVATVFV